MGNLFSIVKIYDKVLVYAYLWEVCANKNSFHKKRSNWWFVY